MRIIDIFRAFRPSHVICVVPVIRLANEAEFLQQEQALSRFGVGMLIVRPFKKDATSFFSAIVQRLMESAISN